MTVLRDVLTSFKRFWSALKSPFTRELERYREPLKGWTVGDKLEDVLFMRFSCLFAFIVPVPVGAQAMDILW